jgi:hypothetical protein
MTTTMTEPRPTELAALLRELALLARFYGQRLETGEPGDMSMAADVYATIERARAAADQLQPQEKP